MEEKALREDFISSMNETSHDAIDNFSLRFL